MKLFPVGCLLPEAGGHEDRGRKTCRGPEGRVYDPRHPPGYKSFMGRSMTFLVETGGDKGWPGAMGQAFIRRSGPPFPHRNRPIDLAPVGALQLLLPWALKARP